METHIKATLKKSEDYLGLRDLSSATSSAMMPGHEAEDAIVF